MRPLVTVAVTWLLATLSLAACAGPTPVAPTPSATVLVEATSPPATEAPDATRVSAASPTPATTDSVLSPTATVPALTPTAAGTASATPGQAAALGGDPLLRTYRSMVAIQVNAALVAEAVAQVQAGRIDQEEMPVAALALGALTQSVDEALPSVEPPPALAAQWDEAVAQHEAVKALGARWLIGQATVDEVAAALVPMRADLQRLLAEADAAVAAEYGVSTAELTEHRERLVSAVGGVFE